MCTIRLLEKYLKTQLITLYLGTYFINLVLLICEQFQGIKPGIRYSIVVKPTVSFIISNILDFPHQFLEWPQKPFFIDNNLSVCM